MVCLGNICRSPLAEAILQSKLPQTNFIVDSAGTGGWHVNQKPDERSIQTALKHGLDITQQRGRQIQKNDFEVFDYIYVMDHSNFKNVLSIAPNESGRLKVKMILNESHPNQNLDVPDPYYGGQDGFELVYDLLDNACTIIAEKLTSNHQ